MSTLENEIEAVGLDEKKIASIARRISKAAIEAREMGITIFGGSGSGTLRYFGYNDTRKGEGNLIVAYLEGAFDGGDGATYEDDDGLQRGEY